MLFPPMRGVGPRGASPIEVVALMKIAA